MNVLLNLIREQMLPWVEGGEHDFLNAHDLQNLPAFKTLQVSRRKNRGRRQAVRGKQVISGGSDVIAAWPEDRLIEARYPKLVCVLAGQADLVIGDRLVRGGPGSFIYLPPGTPHPGGPGTPSHIEPDRPGPEEYCDLLWFMLLRQRVQAWTCHSRGTDHFHVKTEHWMIIEELPGQIFGLLAEEAERGRGRGSEICRKLLSTFLTAIQRELESERYLHPGPMLPTEAGELSRTDDPVRQAQEYMRAHLHQSLTLESVARRVYLSRSEFAARLKSETKRSFVEILTEYRMKEAQALLRDTDWTVTAIAEFVGFKSLAHFHTLFGLHISTTPGKYRQTVREENQRRNRTTSDDTEV